MHKISIFSLWPQWMKLILDETEKHTKMGALPKLFSTQLNFYSPKVSEWWGEYFLTNTFLTHTFFAHPIKQYYRLSFYYIYHFIAQPLKWSLFRHRSLLLFGCLEWLVLIPNVCIAILFTNVCIFHAIYSIKFRHKGRQLCKIFTF